jgi:hypothetical protein
VHKDGHLFTFPWASNHENIAFCIGDSWEKQTKRQDAILDAQEKLLGIKK